MGWRHGRDDPLVDPDAREFDFFRIKDGLCQFLSLEFEDGENPQIAVTYSVWIGIQLRIKQVIDGEFWERVPSIPFWKRFLGLEKGPPSPEDPVGATIEKARGHLDAVNTFLNGGERHPHIQVSGFASDTWPTVPKDDDDPHLA
ncbi:hypothetical protein [Phenylobacterium sp.]|jgi:hypothetical protein|uniref:hypothetical protein n=1 Tax=Phenylobacterium sp. TaxID=1871053 RepID=UPI002F421C3F